MPRATLHNRQDSLERALHLFWQKGFHATSLKDLERTLDMRPGSIYAAFGSKDALFQEALERYARLGLVDALNKWGLILIGAALLLGSMTRLAAFFGTLLLLLYYLLVS